jgi:lysophospholipid acyltransferase (LPLAT)-like uncharacterized protein
LVAAKNTLGPTQRLGFWLACLLGTWLAKCLLATCRVELINPDVLEGMKSTRIRVVGATWHRASIFFLYYFRNIKPAVMISRSKDGEYLARFVENMGGVAVRGSSQHGGIRALDEMADVLISGKCPTAGTVPDGPRGPRYKAKKGMIVLAQRTGLPLATIMWSADRAWVLRKTWDLTMIPKPFARIKMKAGKVFNYPPEMSPGEMERARQELEDELNRLRKELDAACGQYDMD